MGTKRKAQKPTSSLAFSITDHLKGQIRTGQHPVTSDEFFCRAIAFYRSAAIIAAAGEFDFVPLAVLVSHSLELAFKAYLLAHGANEGDLRRISHDIVKACDEAAEKGLPLRPCPGWIGLLNSQHASPHLYRYPRKGFGSSLPGNQKSVVEELLGVLELIALHINHQEPFGLRYRSREDLEREFTARRAEVHRQRTERIERRAAKGRKS